MITTEMEHRLGNVERLRPGLRGLANISQRLMDSSQVRNCSRWSMLSMMLSLLIVIYILEGVNNQSKLLVAIRYHPNH